MNLWTQTILLSASMVFFCALPLLSERVRDRAKLFFLIGTGALFGICFFDLVPDVFELGGSSSLYVMGGVWILYSIAHLLHLGHHEHEIDSHDCASSRSSVGFGLFFGSLAAHCFASGLLLSVSHGLSARIAGTVFAALFAHKAYESLLFTSILLEQRRSRLWKGMMVAAYALALPVGVAAASLFGAHLHQQVAVLISSIAVGTLLGCLLFDFLIPSLRQIESLRYKAGWILFGLALTRVVMLRL